MSRLSRSRFITSSVAICLCLTLTGPGCGKSEKRDEATASQESASTKPVPERIRVSFEGDPGFWVPLATLDRFDSFNRMLPAEMRSAATWASLELTMADGTVEVVNTPQKRFGEVGYQLRAAEPGMDLVAFDKETKEVKAKWGPLAKLHVTPTEAANFKPKPLAIVIDGKIFELNTVKLASLPIANEPNKNKPAWKLASAVASLSPGCVLSALSVSTGETSTEVESEYLPQAYLRANRRGVWIVSLIADDGTPLRERVFDVTGMDVGCRRQDKNK